MKSVVMKKYERAEARFLEVLNPDDPTSFWDRVQRTKALERAEQEMKKASQQKL